MACRAYCRIYSCGSDSAAFPPICSSPHSNGCTRRLSSVVHRRCSYRRILRSNHFMASRFHYKRDLDHEETEAETHEIRKCTHTDGPLGTAEFLRGLEQATLAFSSAESVRATAP